MKAILKVFIVSIFLAAVLPFNHAHAFGDDPRWSGYGYGFETAIGSGCSKWNWQQYSWYDHCPAYVHPKAYMYPRSYSRAILRTKG